MLKGTQTGPVNTLEGDGAENAERDFFHVYSAKDPHSSEFVPALGPSAGVCVLFSKRQVAGKFIGFSK